MMIREPVVAGQFYPGNPERCRAELLELLEAGSADYDSEKRPVGGIVPHAGWVYSGAVAAKVFNALAASRSPDVIVLLGGVHRFQGREAALCTSGRWETPLGPVQVDNRLAERIMGHTNLIVDDAYAHEDEHSIEVQMPFVKHLFPEAKVVPIMVPATRTAHEIGEAVGRTLTAYKYDALVVGTTDLTHYGPRYGYVPHGVGAKGNTWAKDQNDRRFVDMVCAMKAKELVPEAVDRKNACAGGAAAATVTAAAALGATKGVLLQQTTSSEVVAGRMPNDQHDSVGYAAVVFE
ncbi:MAG: AmmeMemoRadiSam system protein B [Phycisphaerales bacterium]|nr:MAG: AmmeMemoRadiSam system protein B [Phycisphaerales bacterium]